MVGLVAASVLGLLRDRYEHVTTKRPAGGNAVVTLAGVDEAGGRAVLDLLRDTGHRVRSVHWTE